MSYRPITDVWILARSKTKYYGAYPAGFLHRARALMGVSIHDPILHVCAGKIREYPFKGLGKNDKTLDFNPKVEPDYLRDASYPFPTYCLNADHPRGCAKTYLGGVTLHKLWAGVMIDRPYTDEDLKKYLDEGLTLEQYQEGLVSVNLLLKNALEVIPVGGRVGILDYSWPGPPGKTRPKSATEVAVIAVGCGRNSRARWFTVWERTK